MKMAVWVLATRRGEILMLGNPNRCMPPFSVGDLERVLHGCMPVSGHTKYDLEHKTFGPDARRAKTWWNSHIRKNMSREQAKDYFVKPRKVTFEMHDCK
jgi:hypothetical protein